MDKLNNEKGFLDVVAGDVVYCYDEYTHEQIQHMMVVESIEENEECITETNPKGRVLYGRDIIGEDEEEAVNVVYESNFEGVRPAPSTAKELYDIVYNDYMQNSVELSTAYFDFNVKMPKRDILLAFKNLQEDINGDYVCREEKGKEYDEDDNFIPAGEYDTIYEGNCMEFLDSFDDDRFKRYDSDDMEEEFDFIF